MQRPLLVRQGETAWNVQRRYQGQSDVRLSDGGSRPVSNLFHRRYLRLSEVCLPPTCTLLSLWTGIYWGKNVHCFYYFYHKCATYQLERRLISHSFARNILCLQISLNNLLIRSQEQICLPSMVGSIASTGWQVLGENSPLCLLFP